jgi:hypothetical protein
MSKKLEEFMKSRIAAITVIAAWTAAACGPPTCPCEAREGHEASAGAGQVKEHESGMIEEPETDPAAGGSQSGAVKEALLELFRHCHSGEIEKAAAYVLYRGSDEKGAWKRTCSYAEADERDQVEEVCAAINGYLHEGGNPEFLEFSTETESEGQWLVWKVRFKAAGGSQEAFFAFLAVGGGYAIGDID